MKITFIEKTNENTATVEITSNVLLGIEKSFILFVSFEAYGEDGDIHGVETTIEKAFLMNNETPLPVDCKIFNLIDSYENGKTIEDKIIEKELYL